MMHHHLEIVVQLVLALELGKSMELNVIYRIIVDGSPSPDTYNSLDSFKNILAIKGFRLVLPQNNGHKGITYSSFPGPGTYFKDNVPIKGSYVPTLKGRIKIYSNYFLFDF